MFTGIIQALGKVRTIERTGGDATIVVDPGKLDLSATKVGDSIAVNGACLTVTQCSPAEFRADVSRETLTHTTLGDLRPGQPINLEKALLPTTPLGGHFVSGHVDAVGTISRRYADGRSLVLEVTLPHALMRYVAVKGSIAIDGISLTINTVRDDMFSVNLIPQTQSETTLTGYASGAKVNIEVDMIARYLERLMLGSEPPRAGSLSLETLISKGFYTP